MLEIMYVIIYLILNNNNIIGNENDINDTAKSFYSLISVGTVHTFLIVSYSAVHLRTYNTLNNISYRHFDDAYGNLHRAVSLKQSIQIPVEFQSSLNRHLGMEHSMSTQSLRCYRHLHRRPILSECLYQYWRLVLHFRRISKR